jgi:hypothetical protein
MHVNQLPGAGTFVQVVHILGNQEKVTLELVFELRQICGLAAKPSGVATSSTGWFAHSPSEALKVSMPDSAEIPAPVSTTIEVGSESITGQ